MVGVTDLQKLEGVRGRQLEQEDDFVGKAKCNSPILVFLKTDSASISFLRKEEGMFPRKITADFLWKEQLYFKSHSLFM